MVEWPVSGVEMSRVVPVRFVVTDTRGRAFLGTTRRRALLLAENAQEPMPDRAPDMTPAEALVVATLSLRQQTGEVLTEPEQRALADGAQAALTWLHIVYRQFK